MEEKKRNFKKLKVLGAILVVVLVIGFFVWEVYYSNTFVLRSIKVRFVKTDGEFKAILPPLTREDILKLTGLKGGENLFKISLSKIKRQILKNPEVERVTLVRHLPDTLEVIVKKRTPVAMIELRRKKYLVDPSGIVICEVKNGESIYLPLLVVKNQAYEKRVLKLLRWLQKNKRYLPVLENLSKVEVNKRNLIFITESGIKIYFPLDSKKSWKYFYKNLDRIMSYVYSHDLDKRVRIIRLDYPLGRAMIKLINQEKESKTQEG